MDRDRALDDELVELVGAATLALVGQVLGTRTGTVERLAFQRWAAAAMDRNPLYFDPTFARAQGHPDVVMPPLFIQYVPLGVVHLDELNPDGTATDVGIGALPLPLGTRIMAGGLRLDVRQSAYPGEQIEATSTLTSVDARRGRSGAFALVHIGTDFRRAGTVVSSTDATYVARP